VRGTAAASHGEELLDYPGNSAVVVEVHKLLDAEVAADSAAVEVVLRQSVSAVSRWVVVLGHDREPLVVARLVPVPVGLIGVAIHDTLPVRTSALLEKARPPALKEKLDLFRCLLESRPEIRCLRESRVRFPRDSAGVLEYVVVGLVHGACVDNTCCKDTWATPLPHG